MKRRVVFVVIFLTFCNCAYAQWWKQLGGALLGGVADKYIQQCGYTPQESRQIISDVTSALGGDSHNVERGIDFLASDKNGRINMAVDVALETTGELTGRQDITSQIQKGVGAGFAVSNADNEYEKANIIAGTAMDVVGDLTDGHVVTDKISAYVDANMSYLSDVAKAETVADLQKAVSKKNQAYKDLVVDIGMDLYDRKVAQEEAERRERGERMREQARMEREEQERIRQQQAESSVASGKIQDENIQMVQPREDEKQNGFGDMISTASLAMDGVNEVEKPEESLSLNAPADAILLTDSLKDVDTIAHKSSSTMAEMRKESVTDSDAKFVPASFGGKSQEHGFADVVLKQDVVGIRTDVDFDKPAEKQNEQLVEVPHPDIERDEAIPEGEMAVATYLRRMVLDNYAQNEVALSPDNYKRLSKIAEALKHNPELRINLVVYTSLNESSKTIGYARAREAREYLLIEKGIGSERVFVKESDKVARPKADKQRSCIAITVFRRGESEKELGEI